MRRTVNATRPEFPANFAKFYARLEQKPLPPPKRGRSRSRTRKGVKDVRPIRFCEQQSKCWYCGVKMTYAEVTMDHLVPFSRRGPSNYDNLVVCCVPCNTAKADMDVEEFRATRGGVFFHGERNTQGRSK